MTNDPFRDQLVGGALEHLHPDIRTWDLTGRAEHAITAEIDQDLARIDNAEFSKQFHEAVPIPGRTDNDYRFHRFELDGVAIIASIGFVGLRPDQPFVRIAQMSQPVTTNDQRDRLTRELAQPFEMFRPDRVRFYQPAHHPYQFDGCAGDMRLIGGPIAHMRSITPASIERVTLTRATGLAWYDRYREIYREIHDRRPWLVDVAAPESEEDMRAYVTDDAVYEIHIDGQWAGITGASAGSRQGLHGHNVIEIILGAAHRGQHLGPAVQHHLAKSLPANDGDCLFGTIGADNRPALRAATEAGRTDLGGDYWVPIQHD